MKKAKHNYHFDRFWTRGLVTS